MNNDLKLIFEWLCANRLSLNTDKTEFLIFRPPKRKIQRVTLSLNQKTIFESNKIKYLGLILDNKLNWKHHISELSKKLSRSLGIICKIKPYCTRHVLKSLFYSLFNSHLSYGLSTWGINISDPCFGGGVIRLGIKNNIVRPCVPVLNGHELGKDIASLYEITDKRTRLHEVHAELSP